MGRSTYAFCPILFAHGTLLSGLIATQVLYEGQALTSFRMEAAGMIAVLVLFVLSPLLIFSPLLERAQRRSAAEFGLLAQRYVSEFEQKWIHDDPPGPNKLLGSPDIQSLADMGNSFSVVTDMRIFPFTLKDATYLAVAAGAPLLPLGLTVLSLEELLGRIFKAII